MYREDYDRAGYLVLPRGEVRPGFAVFQTMLPLLALLSTSLLYSIGAFLLTLGFFYYGAQFALRRSVPAARRLLAASILYLPLMFALMILG